MKKIIFLLKKIKQKLWHSKFMQSYFDHRIMSSLNGNGIIYMLHRCAPIDSTKLEPNESLKITPETLEKFIIKIKKTTKIISLDELYLFLKSKKMPKEKFAIFTFDDGYLDNLTYALPIFQKHKIPFTIYVSTSFPNKTVFLWWFILEDLLLQNNLIITNDNIQYDISSHKLKVIAFHELRKKILSFPQEKIKKYFFDFFQISNYDETKFDALLLSWNDIIELSHSPFCTIAAHTTNHFNLKKLTKSNVIKEIQDSINELEYKIQKSVQHFAYPYGSKNEVSNREIFITKNMNIKTAVLSYGGAIKNKHIKKRTALPRVFLTEKYCSKQE